MIENDELAPRAKWLDQFWAAIDNESVRPFVWLYYVSLLCWGIYGTFFAAPLTSVQPVMGQLVYNAWTWLHIVATSIVMAGLYLETVAKKAASVVPPKMGFLALSMQCGGHACMGLVLFAYEYSFVIESWGSRGTYGVFVIAPYVVGCVALTLQTSRKMWHTRVIRPVPLPPLIEDPPL